MVSIVLAIAMIMVVALYFTGADRVAVKDSYGRYQASLRQMPLVEAENLARDNEQLEIGLASSLEIKTVNDYKLTFTYMDENLLRMGKLPSLQGQMPQAANEVVVESAYLAHIGSNAQVRDSILFAVNGMQGDYTISGILPSETDARSYTVIISQALLSERAPSALYSVYLRLKDSDDWDSRDISWVLSEIASNNGIAEDDLIFSPTYFSLHDRFSFDGIIIAAVIAIVVALACALVIYSLFYVSIISKTQEYGLLRIIGTTKKQIEKIVQREAVILCVRSLPIGVVLGGLTSYLLNPDGWHWPGAIVMTLIACAIMVIVIMAASRKPVKLAAKVTPVEAMRHTSYADDGNDKDTKKLHRSLTPCTLAGINMGRNKKKTILTILSLGICGILLMTSASYLNSIDIEEQSLRDFPHGELNIILEGIDSSADIVFRQQQNNLFTETLIGSIQDLDGVEEVTVYRGAYCETETPSGIKSGLTYHGYSREDEKLIIKDLFSGTTAYDELLAGNGVVLDNASLWKDVFGWEPALGDIFSVRTVAGETVELTVMGLREEVNIGSGAVLYVPEELLPELQPGIDNRIYQISVKAENRQADRVETSVRELLSDHPGTYIETRKDEVARLQADLGMIKSAIYIIVIFIGVFGLINLINTLMTNVIVRKKELSVLQTLGLTDKQLRQMITTEGLYYVLGTAVLTLSIGTLCGYLFCRMNSTVGTFIKVIYQFPGVYAALYLASVVLVQIVFSFVSLNSLKKESLVERIREG